MEFDRLNHKVFEYYSRLGRLREYVDTNYSERITLETAAQVALLESTYFSSYFKKRVGISFSEWLRQVRVTKAIALMRDTDFSITRIAFDVGFDGLRTFERAFKKHTGRTPVKFREAFSCDQGRDSAA